MQHLIGPVAQTLERGGKPHWRQRVEFYFRFVFGRKRHRLLIEHRDMRLVQIRKFAGAGQHLLAPCDIDLPWGPRRRDLALDQVLFEACEHAPSLLDFLEQCPRGFAKRLCQGFDAAGAGRGIGDFSEIGLFQQHQLGVARHPPRERIRQSQRQGMRQHRDGIGAAEAGGEGRNRCAQHVHVRVALGQHPPCGLCGDEDRLGREAAGLFDARPQQPQRTELCHREILIGVGDEAKRQRRTGCLERDAAGFERAQISDRDREREGKLLRLRSAGIVDGPAVRQHERSFETAADQFADHPRERPFHLSPRRCCGASRGKGGQRLIVEADIDLGGVESVGFDDICKVEAGIAATEHRIDRDRDPGVEKDAIEHPRQCFPGSIGNTEPPRARSTRKFQFQACGAVLQIVQRLRVGGGSVGMVDPLHDLPGLRLCAALDRRHIARAGVDRFDPQPVIALADQFFERRALQHAVDQPAPVVIARGLKIRREPQIVGHRCHFTQITPLGRPYWPEIATA